MDSPGLRSGISSGSPLEEWISASYSQILKCCLGTGIAPSEAEDIAQDIWLWLLKEGKPARDVSMPWLTAVARNFILRYRRRKHRWSRLEGGSLDVVPEPRSQETLPDLEAKELLDRVADHLPEIERRMLRLIRSGHSVAEAARLLGIPHGSWSYHLGRLVACARHELAAKGFLRAPEPSPRAGSHVQGRRVPEGSMGRGGPRG